MGQWQLPSPLSEARSDKREEYELINALRRAVLSLTGGGAGLSLFSTAIGRGDGLTTLTDGNEVIGLQFHLPAVYSSFTVNFAGEVTDSASNGVFRIRMGGTWGVASSGVVVATLTASTTGFVYTTVEATVVSNTQTLLTMTLQSTFGHKAQFRGGGVSLN